MRRGEGVYNMAEFHKPKPASEDDADDQSCSSHPTTEDRDQVNVISDNADTGVDENHKQAENTRMIGANQASPPVNIQDRVNDSSPPANRSRAKEADPKSSEPSREIPKYSQTLNPSELESHQAFPLIRPNFYIVFSTFSSLVVLRTEYEAVGDALSYLSIVGTKRTRGWGMWENRDLNRRNLYVCHS